MTIVMVLVLGLGLVFIASSLDDTPILQTFQKIMSGQKINWSGSSNTVSQ